MHDRTAPASRMQERKGIRSRASSGRSERRNTRQPTYVAARCRSKRHPADLHLPAPWQGRRKEGWREGCGEPRSDDDEPSQLLHYYPTPFSLRHQSTLDHCIVITMSFIGEQLFLLLDGGCYLAFF